MKKIFALLLAVMMLAMSCAAFADETAKIGFDIKMDKLPEGYQYKTGENGEDLQACFYKGDADSLIVYVTVGHSCDFDDYTFNEDLTDEQLADALEVLTEDYADPTYEVITTDYGTKVIVVNENGAASDYADMFTVWNGYVIAIGLQKTDDITAEDIELARQIVSDMWIVEQ